MGSLVIVAIPEDGDRVWKISSEKVPHLTLLFLGDSEQVSNLDQIMQFVEHAANTSLRRFWLPVDRRGELGEAKADVLFFKKGRYDFKAVRDFRSLLLKDDNIKSAHDATSQFEVSEAVGKPGQPWIPHLTLGYPDTPAKPIPDDHMSTIYDVSFNRIAVWTGDYDGPEFVLKDYWDEYEFDFDSVPMDVAMSSISRNGGPAVIHISEEPWSNYSESDYTLEQWHAACLIHTHEGDPTSKSECKLPVKTPDGTLNRNGVHAAAAALAGARGGLKGVSEEQKTKAASALKRYYAQLDEEPPESLTQAAIAVGSDFLEHYGVKGMRWGVRKEATDAGGHIRISNRTNQASVSTASSVAFVGLGPLGLATFMHPRPRAEFKAAYAHNKNVKLDKKWKKQVDKSKKAVEVHNTAADEINKKIGDFNNDKRWKDADGKDIDLTKDPAKQKEYDDAAVKEVINPAYANAAVKVYGSQSPSGRYKFEVNDASTGTLKLRDSLAEARVERLKHADEDNELDVDIEFLISRDANGHILGFELADEEARMEHAFDLGAEFLAHYGVKGMRWGVRKEQVGAGAKAVGTVAKKSGGAVGKAARATARFAGDVSFENRVENGRAREAVINAAHKPFKKEDLPAVKARHGDYGKLTNRAKKPFSKEARAYRKDAKETYIKRLETEANKMKNPSGNRQYTIRERGWDQPAEGGDLPTSKLYWDVTARDVKHALEDLFTRLEVVVDDEGYITDLKQVEPEETLVQSMDLGSVLISSLMDGASLEHYGVKGMRWGVRKERPAPVAVAPTATSRVPRGAKRKTKIEVEGGENHPASDDAIKVAQTKAKLRKSGTAALSNKELQDLQTRLNLERNVTQLMPVSGAVAKGRKFVRDLTGYNKDINEALNTGLNTRAALKKI